MRTNIRLGSCDNLVCKRHKSGFTKLNQSIRILTKTCKAVSTSVDGGGSTTPQLIVCPTRAGNFVEAPGTESGESSDERAQLKILLKSKEIPTYAFLRSLNAMVMSEVLDN